MDKNPESFEFQLQDLITLHRNAAHWDATGEKPLGAFVLYQQADRATENFLKRWLPRLKADK